MTLAERKRKILEELYYPFFRQQGFRKRSDGDLYMSFDNKLIVIVRLIDTRKRSMDSFSIEIGLKLNRRLPTRMKVLSINMDNCDASLNIGQLVCLSHGEKIDEYAYDIGYLFGSETLKDIGAKDPVTTIFNSYKGTKEIIERTRITKCQIKSRSTVFDKNDKLISRQTSIFHDLSTFNGIIECDDNCKQFTKDLNSIAVFLNEIVSLEIFFNKDTSHIISESLKEYLTLRLSINKSKAKGRRTEINFQNKLVAECNRVLLDLP